MKNSYVVGKEIVSLRLDKALTLFDSNNSREFYSYQIKEGNVKVNGEIKSPSYKVKEDDVIDTTFINKVLDESLKPYELELDIVYEDDDVAVVNKDRGMVVHPAAGHASGTLVNGLMGQLDNLSGINGELRPGIVHRIDKDTSGLLMVAKHDVAHRHLVDQLVEKSVTRKYTALVHGVIPHNLGTIEAPIGRNPKERQDMAVIDDGKDAVTHFNVIERFENFTLIECILETGRTHQIRVHMKYIGYPLAGDPKYGPRKTLEVGGQLLHAGVLGFIHPKTEEYMEFKTELPEYFTDVLDEMRLTEKK